MSVSMPYKKAAIALTIIFGLSFMLVSCASSKGAGCQNGFVGYGEKVHAIKGPRR